MDPKTVLTQAKAKIATMETWCQGTLARRPWDDDEYASPESSRDRFHDVDPHDPRACQWCLDGAVHAVLKGLAYTEKDDEAVELYRAVAGQLADCSVKFFDTTEFVAVNDGDDGIPPEIAISSRETAKQLAFENAHKILDCAIASA